MSPIEQEDTVTEALAAALEVIVTDSDGDQWRLVQMTLDGGRRLGAASASRFVDPVAAALATCGWTLVRSEELAGLRAIEEAARDYDPEREHSWRCEYRTTEAGWTVGEPPVIDCECGYDDLRAALEKGAPR